MSQSGSGRHDRRSPMSVGLQWASVVTTIGMEMAMPPLLGAWIDNSFGTGPWWTVALAALGFFAAMRHLWALAKRIGSPQTDSERGPGARPRRDGKGGAS